jgi:hypothetical protein
VDGVNPAHAFVVFLAAILLDVVWAQYTIAIARLHKFQAAGWAVGIVVCGLVNVDAYIASRWYVVPAALGGGIGTFVAIHLKEGR